MNAQKQGKMILHRRFLTCYKKNTLAIGFSFVLTLMLATIMLVLIHSNHRIQNIQYQTIFTPSDCRVSDLSGQQVLQLKSDSSIAYLAVEQQYYHTCTCNGQNLYLSMQNDTGITMMAKIIQGRLPQNQQEVVAEKWVLLNLGVEPVLNREFEVLEDTGQKKVVKLVGILSDMFGNKKYGTKQVYTTMDWTADEKYNVYLRFQDTVAYGAKIKSLISELGINKKQVKKCPAREDYQELYCIDAQIIGVILVIYIVVFYGIYRITLITREKPYGILRVLGMKRKQLQNMILLELYQIYGISIPVGIGAGLLLSLFIMKISEDKDNIIYLYNQRISFVPVLPVKQIFFCVAVMAVLIGGISCLAGRKMMSKPMIEAVSGAALNGGKSFRLFRIGKTGGKIRTLCSMSCKYIFRDMKTSSFLVLTISTGVILFTGLAYKARTLQIYREDTKETWYLNGQYEMNMLGFDSPYQGISRKSAEEIQKLPQVSLIKTAAGIPVRVIDEDGVKRNDGYYNELNANLREIYGYENAGYDGRNQVYKSILYGYNTAALKELKKYVISGDFEPENMKEDEIILRVLSMDDTKQNDIPGPYKEGTPLMQYHVGDSIQIKYRADLKTEGITYKAMEDYDKEYIYKTYKIAAIVSFEYMQDCNRTVYPLLITGDWQLQNIVPDSSFQCMYVDGEKSMTIEQQISLERKLIRIGTGDENVSTRSLISEISQNEMFYRKQMIYIYGIAAVAFVLVLINMINNLRYRMQTRTGEICMLRAIGMSVAMTKKILLFENLVLGAASVFVAFFLSQPVLRYLYGISDMKAFGHKFYYDYAAFSGVSAAALLLCVFLSQRILKSWKTKRIMEAIGKVE